VVKSTRDVNKPFISHLQELRSRFLICLLIFLSGSVLGYIIQDKILYLLLLPLDQALYYSSPAGGFNFTFGLAFLFGFLITIPFFIFHTLRFIEPALPDKVKHSFIMIFLSASLLMLFGIIFAYFVSLPAALHFLGKFTSTQVKSLISTGEYLSFVTRYLIGFGVIFQLPLVMLVVNQINKLDVKTLVKLLRWVVLLSFVIAGIITPTPDLYNQVLMAVPIIVLYLLSAGSVWFVNGRTVQASHLGRMGSKAT